MQVLLIGLAGVLGAWLRYAVGAAAHAWWSSPVGAGAAAFPWGTWIANMAGSLALGWMNTRFTSGRRALPEAWRLAWTTGLIGSFTTFSTFSVETLSLIQHGRAGLAAGYAASSAVCGFAAVYAGHLLGRGKR